VCARVRAVQQPRDHHGFALRCQGGFVVILKPDIGHLHRRMEGGGRTASRRKVDAGVTKTYVPTRRSGVVRDA
jgi:hypothetical protein